jgi:UDP-hydrolysing UDP-N-acetyl-D-glucosamine 2-epimerase
VFTNQRPDLAFVVGDRFEMFAAATAAYTLGAPVVHLHGGEVTTGSLDEGFRHAITKLAHLHFVSTERAAARVRQLGEEEWRVLVTGAPALDAVDSFEDVGDEGLEALLGFRVLDQLLVVTVHPDTLGERDDGASARAVIDAVRTSGLAAVFTAPNADAGHDGVLELLEEAVAHEPRFSLVRSLGRDAYFSLLRRAAAMVGNSSSGIIEAASFRLPVVNVGTRQDGRERGRNVVDVDLDAAAIVQAIRRVTVPAFRDALVDLGNPYGDGKASERIVEMLATVPLDDRLLRKAFVDVDGRE